MCGRFTLRTSGEQLASFFLAASMDIAFPSFKARYNIAPSQIIATVRWSIEEKKAEFAPMRWGLIPSWAKDAKIGYKMINARSETLGEKPSFRAALKRRRCLIPVDGFYEWLTDGKLKRPFFIRRPGDRPMVFAGIWEQWNDLSGAIESTTIITCAANQFMTDLHERMPVILEPSQFHDWLVDPKDIEKADWSSFFKAVPDEYLERHEVAPIVNSPKNEVPDCIVESNGFLF